MKAFVGCSGFNYRGWKGNFYPVELPQSQWLQFYCENFNTIEINATFYRFPKVTSLNTWYSKTPDDFIFTVKVPQVITHFKRFKETRETTEKFYGITAEGLREKLHCVFFQLPPSISYSNEMLDSILDNLDLNYKNVIEFRHASWWNKEVFEVFKKNRVIFCSSSFPKLPEDLVNTSDDIYVRFHGKEALYKSSYSDVEIKEWVTKIKRSKPENAYVYFNNTWFTAAIDNAKKISKLLEKA